MKIEIKNRERLKFGLLEFTAIVSLILLLYFKAGLLIENIFNGYFYWILGVFFYYLVPLLFKGNHIIGKLLNFQITDENDKELNGKQIIIRQSLKLVLIMTAIDAFHMLLVPNGIPYYDKILNFRIYEYVNE